MLIIDLDMEVNLVSEGFVDEERELINIKSPSLLDALQSKVLFDIVSVSVPLDSPHHIVVETDDPFVDWDLGGHVRCFRVQLTKQEEAWICSF